MVGLLDLPLELREPILLEVVMETSEQQPAETPDWADHANGYERVKVTDREKWGSYYCKSLKRHAMQLLQVNQQIRAEVIDCVLRKLHQSLHDAKLDVIFEHGNELAASRLWATWLSAPFPTYHLNTLHIQIRHFQTWKPQRQHPRHPPNVSIMEDCKYWIDPQSARMLLNFVAESLRPQSRGASAHETQRFATAQGSRAAHRTIQKLVINIPVDPDARHSSEARIRCIDCQLGTTLISDKGSHCMVPSGKRAALVFAKSLHGQVLRILNTELKYWTKKGFQMTFFESVGTIDLNVQGRPFGTVNLGQILAKIPSNEEWARAPFRRAEFFEWKRAAEEKRKVAGFEVVRSSVQEYELSGTAGLIASILATRDESLMVGIPPSGHVTLSFTTGSQFSSVSRSATLVQENGTMVHGDATFYLAPTMNWHSMRQFFKYIPHGFEIPSWDSPFVSSQYAVRQGFDQGALEDRPKDGERVLFEAETIVFSTIKTADDTIASGNATFYGQAEDSGTK